MPPSGQDLDALPVKNGFRLRGLQTTRIETFTDAAFAFALTLLVVSLDVPTSYPELINALRGIPAFALSAALLIMFWAAHHTWSRRFGLDDVPTILLSSLLVFTVLIYVYPLRFMFQALTAWIGTLVGVDLTAQEITFRLGDLKGLFVVYGLGFTAMCGAIVLLNLHAWRLREALELDPSERRKTKDEIAAWIIVGGAGLLSALLAAVLPAAWTPLAGWTYALLAIVMPLFSKLADRRAAFPTSGPPAARTSG